MCLANKDSPLVPFIQGWKYGDADPNTNTASECIQWINEGFTYENLQLIKYIIMEDTVFEYIAIT